MHSHPLTLAMPFRGAMVTSLRSLYISLTHDMNEGTLLPPPPLSPNVLSKLLEYQTHFHIILILFQITMYISQALLLVFITCLLGAYPHNTNMTFILSHDPCKLPFL
jgi:hypothetical protein